MQIPRGSWLHLVKLGSRLSPLEWVFAYAVLPAALAHAPAEGTALFWQNALVQVLLFSVVALLPAAVSGHMLYVDIAWPTGVAALGAQLLWAAAAESSPNGGVAWNIRLLLGAVLLLHGGRMMLGALVMFGQAAAPRWSYRFEQDLPRYAFARRRWVEEDGMSPRTWVWKMLHDIATQGLANAVLFSVPAVLAASSDASNLAVLEAGGVLLWAAAWYFENVADLQKLAFMRERSGASSSPDDTVLGLPPYNTTRFWLWTRCRHPNYFFEWLGWLGVALAAVPSLLGLATRGDTPPWVALSLAAGLVMIPRMMWDCLLFWTGAAPSEYFSFRKRKAYGDYQRTTRCFWPFELPGLDHYRVAGWPSADKSD